MRDNGYMENGVERVRPGTEVRPGTMIFLAFLDHAPSSSISYNLV